jgi:hypothetical protein
MANSIDRSKLLHETCIPKRASLARFADEARQRSRAAAERIVRKSCNSLAGKVATRQGGGG